MTTSTPDPRRWAALAVIAVAQFLVIMDTSIIGVALPDIQRALGFSQADLSWVFNAYVVAFGGLLLLGGKLSDVFGPRRMFSAGFVLLVAGSLVAGLAESAAVEVIGRALQGAAAAAIAPAALTLVIVLFSHDPKELTKALGLYGAAAPAGGTAGVFLGGVLTETLDWRWTLLVNVPIAIAVLVAAPRLLPAGVRRSGRIDIAGAVTATAGLALTVFGVVRGNEQGWGSAETLATVGGGIALLGVFAALQASRRDPLLPGSVFRIPNLTSANAVMAILGAAWIPMWFTANLWLQQVKGAGPFEAGAALLPMTVLIMVVMVAVVARVIERVGVKPPMVAGLVLLTAGIALFALVPSDGSGYAGAFLPASLVAALGMSLTFIPAMTAAIGAAPPEQGGLASGIVNTSYQVGSAIGLAAITAISVAYGADKVGDPAALTEGFRAGFLGAAGLAGLGAAVAAVLIRAPRVGGAANAGQEAEPVEAIAA
ncbi:MAG TPA: MFS transporter [Thermoleophilaceae bacterium]|nr:MFS transporter [Thermoleophilaceae bacterium]